MLSTLNAAQQDIYKATVDKYGYVFAERLRKNWAQTSPSIKEPLSVPQESHIKATKLLEPYKNALGPAYLTLHLLARWCFENATEQERAPHLMTTYWTLEEALGLSERTLRRHLVEQGHAWSETIKHFIDVKHNYGKMLDGKDDRGHVKTRNVCVATVIRFFPKGRLSTNARVKKWGQRDLLLESDEGRTRNTRPNLKKHRYQRKNPLMSAYSSVKEQSQENNWLMVKLGQTIPTRVAKSNNLANLYADIPNNVVLHALHEDLNLAVTQAQERGMNIKRARSKWVDNAAQLLAERFEDNKPSKTQEQAKYIRHHDGFTDLWRKLLWTALRAELYGNTKHGWNLIQRMITLIQDIKDEPINNPVAYAWTLIKQEGFTELLRDFDTGSI